jgi:hypothetical protein
VGPENERRGSPPRRPYHLAEESIVAPPPTASASGRLFDDEPRPPWQRSVRDGGASPFVAISATSRLAAESMLGHLGDLQRLVYETILASPGGMTSDDVELELGMKHQTISPRIRELFLARVLIKDGRRLTSSGRSAAVFKVGEW